MVCIQNISRSFPDKKYDEITSIVKEFYVNFADYFIEVLKSVSISSKKLDEKLTVKGFEFVEDQIKNGKQVIACLGHCGNWEILNCLPSKLQATIYSGYKPISISGINKLMYRTRSRFGVKLLPSHTIAKHILSNKNNPAMYLLIGDQCPKLVNNDYSFHFLNQQTTVYPGTEKLARATDATVVYIKIIRTSKGHYQAICQPICESASKMEHLEITKCYMNLLQSNIEEDPGAWLWSHKRWKR